MEHVKYKRGKRVRRSIEYPELAAIRLPTILYIVRKCKCCKQITVNKSPTGPMPPPSSRIRRFYYCGWNPMPDTRRPERICFRQALCLKLHVQKGAFIWTAAGANSTVLLAQLSPQTAACLMYRSSTISWSVWVFHIHPSVYRKG